MKTFKMLMMLAVLAGAMVMVGCSKKNSATIDVKVLKAGVPQANERVYLFRGNLQEAFLEHPVHASKNIATDETGVASFDIKSDDFGAGNDQVTFVFETFDEDENVTGKVAASVRKGDAKTVTINQ